MSKVQDLFVRPDKSKLLDVKLMMQVVDMPTEATIETSEDGSKTYENFYVKLSHQGQVYDFKCNASQMARIFMHKKKDGEIFWKAQKGETINFWYQSPKKADGYPFFAAEPCRDVDIASEAGTVFDEPGTAPVQTPVTEKKTFAPTKVFTRGGARGADETKWDGTPRQNGFRQARAGLLQAILSNPNVDPFDAKQLEKINVLVDKLVADNRAAAKILEETITD